MKIYLIDDDPSVTNILKMIIEKKQIGELCGISNDPEDALDDIAYLEPEIVICDLLMPRIDGIKFIRAARRSLPDAGFIMLSQVSSKDMIASAYNAGCEFFIQKPINAVEVENVIRSVTEKITMRLAMDHMKAALGTEPVWTGGATEFEAAVEDIMVKIGIIGENGCADIIKAAQFIHDNPEKFEEMTVKDLCGEFSDLPKSMEQRIRRAAQVGMTNLANVGLEDYANPVFEDYAGTLYSFGEVRREMDSVRGKSDRHGIVKTRKFLTAMVACAELLMVSR